MLQAADNRTSHHPGQDSELEHSSTNCERSRSELLSSLYDKFTQICQLEKRATAANPVFKAVLFGFTAMPDFALAIARQSPSAPLKELVRPYTQTTVNNETGLRLERISLKHLSLILDAAGSYSEQLRQRFVPDDMLGSARPVAPQPNLAEWSPPSETGQVSQRDAPTTIPKPLMADGNEQHLEQKLAALELKLHTVTAELVSTTQKNSILESTINALEQTLSDLRARRKLEIQSLEQEKAGALGMLTAAHAERDRALAQCSRLANEDEKLREKLKEQNEHLVALKRLAEPNNVALQNARANLQRIASENEGLKQSCTEVGVQLSQALSKLSQRDEVIADLQRQLAEETDSKAEKFSPAVDLNDSATPDADCTPDLSAAPTFTPSSPKEKAHSPEKEPSESITTEDAASPRTMENGNAPNQETGSPSHQPTGSQHGYLFEHLTQNKNEKGFDGFCEHSHPDYEATSALPGSAEKVEVLRRRAELELPLWHPNHATFESNAAGAPIETAKHQDSIALLIRRKLQAV